MAGRRLDLRLLALILFGGLLVGTVLGKALGLILPQGLLRSVLVDGLVYSLEPVTLDLVVLSLTFGFGIDVNVMSVIGVLVLAYLLRWYS